MVCVIRLASCLWLWFQSVSPLMSSLSTYRLTWVSLTLGVEYLFKAAPAKHSCRPWPWTWSSSSRPPSRPWTWGSSSRPLLLHRSRCSFVWIPVFNSMGYTPTSKLLGKNCHCFLEKLHHVIFPLAVCDGRSFPTSSTNTCYSFFYNCSHPGGCEVLSHWDFVFFILYFIFP